MLKRSGMGMLAAALALALGACAGTPASPPPPPPPPNFSAIPAKPLPAKSVLYTDCLAQAIGQSSVAMLADEGAQLLEFTCTGAPAQRFFEALSVMGEAAGSVWTEGTKTYRATAKVQKDLFGVDYCSATAAAGSASCHIVLNAGSFLTSKN